MTRWRMWILVVVLATLAFSGCGTAIDETEADQWQTQVAVAERAYTDFSGRAAESTVAWDENLAPADMAKHLELSLRFLVAVSIKHGVITWEEGTKVLTENGITHKIPRPD